MVTGWESDRFPSYSAFYKVKGVGYTLAHILQPTCKSLLNASYHKE